MFFQVVGQASSPICGLLVGAPKNLAIGRDMVDRFSLKDELA